MTTGKVKIQSVVKLHTKYVNTSEGKKKIEDGVIEVSPETAASLVDGINWKLADEKDSKAIKTLKRKLKQKHEDSLHTPEKETAPDEVETGEVDEETSPEEDAEQEIDEDEIEKTTGDDDTRETLKKVMKLDPKDKKDKKALLEMAEDLGIEAEGLSALAAKTQIIKTLRGK